GAGLRLGAAVAAAHAAGLGLSRRALAGGRARAGLAEGAPPAIVAAGSGSRLDAVTGAAARQRLFVGLARNAFAGAGADVGQRSRVGRLGAHAHARAFDARGQATELAVGLGRAREIAAAAGIGASAARLDATPGEALGVGRRLARPGTAALAAIGAEHDREGVALVERELDLASDDLLTGRVEQHRPDAVGAGRDPDEVRDQDALLIMIAAARVRLLRIEGDAALKWHELDARGGEVGARSKIGADRDGELDRLRRAAREGQRQEYGTNSHDLRMDRDRPRGHARAYALLEHP